MHVLRDFPARRTNAEFADFHGHVRFLLEILDWDASVDAPPA
jgi:hypothetical protein